jgi:hypothetical protein
MKLATEVCQTTLITKRLFPVTQVGRTIRRSNVTLERWGLAFGCRALDDASAFLSHPFIFLSALFLVFVFSHLSFPTNNDNPL